MPRTNLLRQATIIMITVLLFAESETAQALWPGIHWQGTNEDIKKIEELLTEAILLSRGEMREKLESIVLSKQPISINLVRNDKVTVADFNTGTLDVEDIAKLPHTGPSGQVSVVIHEIVEQWEKQSNGQNVYEQAHHSAILVEGHVTRWLPIKECYSTDDFIYDWRNETDTRCVIFERNSSKGLDDSSDYMYVKVIFDAETGKIDHVYMEQKTVPDENLIDKEPLLL